MQEFNELIKIITDKGGETNATVYVASRHMIEVTCLKDGYTWTTCYDYLKQGKWCPSCSGHKKYTIEEFKQIALEKGGLCLSLKYVNGNTPLLFECKENHQWETEPRNIIRGNWCPICVGHGKHEIEEFQEIAKERGGKCLSIAYINSKTKLEFECHREHRWKTRPDAILNGHRCPECAKPEKPSIEKFKKIAKEKGGDCLSTKYVDSTTKLKFVCSEDHQWEAVPGSILKGHWCSECAREKQRKLRKISA